MVVISAIRRMVILSHAIRRMVVISAIRRMLILPYLLSVEWLYCHCHSSNGNIVACHWSNGYIVIAIRRMATLSPAIGRMVVISSICQMTMLSLPFVE
jgi:hypothetical protein